MAQYTYKYGCRSSIIVCPIYPSHPSPQPWFLNMDRSGLLDDPHSACLEWGKTRPGAVDSWRGVEAPNWQSGGQALPPSPHGLLMWPWADWLTFYALIFSSVKWEYLSHPPYRDYVSLLDLSELTENKTLLHSMNYCATVRWNSYIFIMY